MTVMFLVMCSLANQLVDSSPMYGTGASSNTYECVCPYCQPDSLSCNGDINKGCNCEECACGQPGSGSGR